MIATLVSNEFVLAINPALARRQLWPPFPAKLQPIFAGSSSAPQIEAGRLRAIAVASAERSKLFPDLPTIGELYPGFRNSIWLE